MQSIPTYEAAAIEDHVGFTREDMQELNALLKRGSRVDMGGVSGELIAINFITRSLLIKTLHGDVEILLQRPPTIH